MSNNIKSDSNDKDLSLILEGARAGDQEAWELLFRECYPKVRRVVRRKLNRSMRLLYDSTDFAAEVMKSLAANIGQLNITSIDSLHAYLAQVAERKVIQEYRRRHALKRDVSRERPILAGDKESDPEKMFSAEPSASQLAEVNEIYDRLVSRFDETERTLIDLKRQGYSKVEIAERTGWNIRKVERFLKDLMDVLGDDEQWVFGKSSKKQLPVSGSTHPLSVFFDDVGFTEEDIELFLSYLSETYRDLGGIGLRVVDRRILIPDSEPVEVL